MDPALWELLKTSAGRDDEEVEAIVRFDDPSVDVPGVRVVSRFGPIATCRLRSGAILRARAHRNVRSLKASRPLGPEREVIDEVAAPRLRLRASDVRRPRNIACTGASVCVGVIDWGCDFDHPNFKRANGSTRMLALWDQRGPGGQGSPSPFGYGTVYSAAEINAAIASDDPYRAIGYHPADADRDGSGAHGTFVMDVAAGNGRAGGPVGIAPNADLIFVHLADRGTSGLANLGDSVRILEAVDFVARAAGRRPWVINLSVGRHGGPHDGRTLAELALDYVLHAAPGRFIVQSTGNYFDKSCHTSGRLASGQAHVLTLVTSEADVTPNELEVWYDGEDEFVVWLESPVGARYGPVRLGEQANLVDGGRVVGRVYHRDGDPNNLDNHIDLFLYPWAPAGSWAVTIRASRAPNGSFHAWLERDEVCTDCQARFPRADADSRMTTGTIANGHRTLVVGAYDAGSPSRKLAGFSSSGPTRDGRRKPDLVAPGVQVLAARSAPRGARRSEGLLARKSGTSFAAPHVTGAVALCLESAGHRCDARQIRALVLGSAQPHAAKDSEHRLGRGYLDIAGLVSAVQAAVPARIRLHERKNSAMDAELETTYGIGLAPATAYRELLYRPGGRLSAVIEERFDVVGRPGQGVSSPPRAGDVMLQVTLGHPGEGSCAVLIDSGLRRQRVNGAGGASGWYAHAKDAVAPNGPLQIRILDASGRMLPGQLLLRPTATGSLGDVPVEHEFDEDDAEARTPVPVDLAAAVPLFDAAERARVVQPLLSAQASEKAVSWSRRVHPTVSGVTLDEIRNALAGYVETAAVQAAIGATSVTPDAVLVECVHQFQIKCYLDKRDHDGQAGESTLDSLGLIARVGSGLRGADRRNAKAQERLRKRNRELVTATGGEFSAANWFDRMADPSVFGLRTKLGHGMHVALVRKLRLAERHLLTLPALRGLTPAALGTALGLTEKHGGARPSQSESASVHTFGLAIDIAYRGNPWVRRPESWEALQRATSLVSGVGLTQRSSPEYFSSLGSDPARSTGDVWDELQQRNTEFIRYFALGEDDAALRAALRAAQARGTAGVLRSGESLDDAAIRWRTRIQEDRRLLAGGDFDNHEPPRAGFLALRRDLVIALRDHGCLAWGAVDLGPGARGSGDMMHFDARIDGAGRVLTRNTQAFLPTSGHPCLSTAGAPTDAEGDDEPHVLEARAEWAKLFPWSAAMKKVKILDLKQAPSQAIAQSDFSAWTNSPVRIYVAKADGADSAYWRTVLYHESVHVKQFRRADGKPPTRYATMMRYECDAYMRTLRWVAAQQSAAVKSYAEDLRFRAKSFCDEIKAVEKRTSNADEREDSYRAFLLWEAYLPPHDRLTDLYNPVGNVRNPAAAESGEGEEFDEESAAADKAKGTIRAQANSWGTDEVAVMSALRGLLPSQMAELVADAAIVDILRDELSGVELAAAGAQLARGQVGSMGRSDIDRILAAPGDHSLGTLAAAIARDVLLGHQEAFDRTGTGTIHGSQCAVPKPAGATTSDCTEYVKDVLNRTFAAKGQSSTWADVLREATTRSGADGLKGTEVMRALQTMQGWEALFWAPDPRNPGDGQSEHPSAYKVVRTRGTYYGITVDPTKSVVNYRRTNAANPTDMSGVERLRRLQFGVLAARGGTHMAMVVNGAVYEVHRSSAATDRNAVEATPLENFIWESGAIAAPPRDLALAWRTP